MSSLSSLPPVSHSASPASCSGLEGTAAIRKCELLARLDARIADLEALLGQVETLTARSKSEHPIVQLKEELREVLLPACRGLRQTIEAKGHLSLRIYDQVFAMLGRAEDFGSKLSTQTSLLIGSMGDVSNFDFEMAAAAEGNIAGLQGLVDQIVTLQTDIDSTEVEIGKSRVQTFRPDGFLAAEYSPYDGRPLNSFAAFESLGDLSRTEIKVGGALTSWDRPTRNGTGLGLRLGAIGAYSPGSPISGGLTFDLRMTNFKEGKRPWEIRLGAVATLDDVAHPDFKAVEVLPRIMLRAGKYYAQGTVNPYGDGAGSLELGKNTFLGTLYIKGGAENAAEPKFSELTVGFKIPFGG